MSLQCLHLSCLARVQSWRWMMWVSLWDRLGEWWLHTSARVFQSLYSWGSLLPFGQWILCLTIDSGLGTGEDVMTLGALSCILLLTHPCCLSDSKESACNAGDLGLIPEWGRSSVEGNGNPLQYSFLENSMDRGAWLATVHGVVKSQTTIDPSIHPPTPSIYLSVSQIEKCIKETKGN